MILRQSPLILIPFVTKVVVLLQLLLGCGSSALRIPEEETPLIEPYIVGGTPTNNFPAFVRSNSENILCGGTLIHPDIVLTAAHCMGSFDAGVQVGIQDLSNNQGVYRAIGQQRPHPGYAELFLDYVGSDVMVLRLSEPVWDVSPVTLNQNPIVPFDWQDVTAIGMGKTSPQGAKSEKLLEATIFALPRPRCVQALAEFENVIVGNDLLCAGYPNNNESICFGDSGGPVFASINGQEVQVGLTSWTKDCGVSVPDGFARISTFYPWIQKQICDMSAYPPSDCPPVDTTISATDVAVNVVFAHDDDPWETSWAIRHRSTDKVVYAGPQYLPQPLETYSTTMNLEPGRYFLEITDSHGDGLQGKTRTGYFYIQTVNNAIPLLVSTPGIFTRRLRLSFIVPTREKVDSGELTTLEPTPAPTVMTGFPTALVAPTVVPTFQPTPTMVGGGIDGIPPKKNSPDEESKDDSAKLFGGLAERGNLQRRRLKGGQRSVHLKSSRV